MKLIELKIAGTVSAWERLGLIASSITTDGRRDLRIVLPDLTLVFDSHSGPGSSGITGWTFAADDGDETGDYTDSIREMSIDGIATVITRMRSSPTVGPHQLSVLGVDHVVVMTGSLERTCSAITETTGEPLRRVRDAGHGVRQGFHIAGSVIIEVVERPDIDTTSPASLWGLVFTVQDLDKAIAWLGPDAVGSPREAVQPGRRIATVRSDVGLGIPLALMSPHATS